MSSMPLRSAAKGFLITFAAFVLIPATIYLSANLVAANIGDVAFRSEYASMLRDPMLPQAIWTGIWLAAYWSLAAIAGKGNILRIKSANYLLFAAWICYALLNFGVIFFNINTYCDVFPMSHSTFSISRIDECPSSQIASSWLDTSAFALFGFSIISRILVSRHKANITS
jgi:hypothetical protein